MPSWHCPHKEMRRGRWYSSWPPIRTSPAQNNSQVGGFHWKKRRFSQRLIQGVLYKIRGVDTDIFNPEFTVTNLSGLTCKSGQVCYCKIQGWKSVSTPLILSRTPWLINTIFRPQSPASPWAGAWPELTESPGKSWWQLRRWVQYWCWQVRLQNFNDKSISIY